MGDSGAPVSGLLADGADIPALAKSQQRFRGRRPCHPPDGTDVARAGCSAMEMAGAASEQDDQQGKVAGEVPRNTRTSAAEARLVMKRWAAPAAAAEPRQNKCPRLAAPQLLDGPRNFSEVLTVLRPAVAKVVETARAAGLVLIARFVGKDREEIVVTTSYSGMGTPEATISMVRHYFREMGIAAKVTMFSATDVNATCRAALLGQKAESACEHVFGDVLDRIPGNVRLRLETAAARLGAQVARRTAAVSLAKGRRRSRGISQSRGGQAGAPLHHEGAEAAGADSVSSRTAGRLSAPQATMPRVSGEGREQPASSAPRGDRWHYLHGAVENRRWLGMAGQVGLAVHGLDLLGAGRGAGHCPARAHSAIPAPAAGRHCGGKFSCESVVMSPEDWGAPSKRPRRYTMLLHRKWQLPAIECPREAEPPTSALFLSGPLLPGPMSRGAAELQFTAGCFQDMFFKKAVGRLRGVHGRLAGARAGLRRVPSRSPGILMSGRSAGVPWGFNSRWSPRSPESV